MPQPYRPAPGGGGGGRGGEEWAWCQEDHLLSQGHGHPHRHCPRPQGPPLALCPHAKGLQELGAAHPDRGTSPHLPSVFLLEPERPLQGMLEHECPLKNEQVLRVSSGGRGQRPGLGVPSTACPSTACPSTSPAEPGAGDPLGAWGGQASIHSHLLGRQVPLAEGKPLPPRPQLRLQKKARPAEDRGRGLAGWRRHHNFPECWGR